MCTECLEDMLDDRSMHERVCTGAPRQGAMCGLTAQSSSLIGAVAVRAQAISVGGTVVPGAAPAYGVARLLID